MRTPLSVSAPVRILHVLHHPVFGGPHNVVALLHAPLAERGYETRALLTNKPGNAAERMRAQGIPVDTVPLQRLRGTKNPLVHARVMWNFWGDVSRIRRAIRATRAQVVELSGPENLHAAAAGRLEHIGVVCKVLGSTGVPKRLRPTLAGLVRGWSDVVMTAGEGTPYFPEFQPQDLPVVPYYPPVDTTRFDPAQRSGAVVRRALGLPDGALLVGTVGNVNPDKGHGYFVRAAVLVRQEAPDTRFVIVGSVLDSHRSLFAHIQHVASKAGLAFGRDIQVYTPTGDVADALAAMDVFVQSSVTEGVSGALLEAMAMARPIVATAVGGTPGVVQDGVNGYLVPSRDPDAIAAKVLRLLRDPGARTAFGDANRQAALANWTLFRAADQHAKAYHIAIERAAARHPRRC